MCCGTMRLGNRTLALLQPGQLPRSSVCGKSLVNTSQVGLEVLSPKRSDLVDNDPRPLLHVLGWNPATNGQLLTKDPPGPPDSPISPTPACSVHERDNIYSEHKDLGSILYIPHLLIFALEADRAVSSSAPLPECCRLCFP